MIDNDTESVPSAAGPAGASAPVLAAGTLIAARYRVEAVLGIGGSAVVYRVYDERLATRVALKLMRSDRLTEAALVRFRREVAVARTVESEHVIRIHDIDDSEYGVFITMEHAEGESLRSRIERGPMAVDEALAIARQVLEGLVAMHRQHIVHRDIKPGNILIRPDGVVKIADLGLARTFESNELRATQTDGVVGTWEYLAPEQALGRTVDARADLYSFGVVLYECLAGTLPFPHKSSIEGVIARLREAPRELRKIRPDAPRWLAAVVGRLLAKEPAARFDSAEEVLRWIDRRKAPLPWRRITAIAASLLIVVVIATAVVAYVKRPRFARVAGWGTRGMAVLDSDGRILWKNEVTRPHHATLVRRNGKLRWIALVENAETDLRHPQRSQLKFVSPDTGIVEWVATLDDAGSIFSQYPNRFGIAQLSSADIDHNGDDVVVVNYAHTYWPSYTIVFDPSQRMVRKVFYAGGHHVPLGWLDVNGDGRDDLLLGGINNRMGWYVGVAAVDVPPKKQGTLGSKGVASPDLPDIGNTTAPLWYALLPQAHDVSWNPVTDASAKKQIVVSLESDRSVTLDYSGFSQPCPAGMTPEQRQERRREIYGDLRSIERLLDGGDYGAAGSLIDTTVAHAKSIADPTLADWTERVRMRVLVRAGRIADAEQLARRLVETTSDATFDIAQELHLTGHPDEAVRWYREGIARSPDADVGRLRYEFVQGAVLAASERDDWHTAENLVATYARMFPQWATDANIYSNFIRWRRGQSEFLPMPNGPNERELVRYWQLEFTRVSRPDVDLLPLIDADEKSGNSLQGLLWSLKAEVLASRGNLSEALKLAQASVEWCDARAGSDTIIHGHQRLVHERLLKIAAMKR